MPIQSGTQIATASVEFAIGAPLGRTQGGDRIFPVRGAKLIPANEIDALKDMFYNKNKGKRKKQTQWREE